MDLQRFILAENLGRLRARLQNAPGDQRLQQLVAATERELAMFEAEDRGLVDPWGNDDRAHEAALNETLAWFDREYRDSQALAMLVDPRPGLMILNVNPAHAAATGQTPANIAGRPLFDAFPDSPDDPEANGVANLYASLRRVAETGVSETMPVQRYDTQDPDDGHWIARYWRLDNSVIKDAAGRVIFLLHLVAEVDGPD